VQVEGATDADPGLRACLLLAVVDRLLVALGPVVGEAQAALRPRGGCRPAWRWSPPEEGAESAADLVWAAYHRKSSNARARVERPREAWVLTEPG
jgi:hypothetical protein